MWTQIVKFFGDENSKTLKSFQKHVDKINELEEAMHALKDDEFPYKTCCFLTFLIIPGCPCRAAREQEKTPSALA